MTIKIYDKLPQAAKKPEENDMARKCCREPRKKLKRQVGKELDPACILNEKGK